MYLSHFTSPNPYSTVFYGSFDTSCDWHCNDVPASISIEWLVLHMDHRKSRALLLSKYALAWESFADCPIIGHGYKTSWHDSYLRKWLNGDFYQQCFSDDEKKSILSIYNASSSGNGSRSIDKIFLLSVDEVKKYFSMEESAAAMVQLFDRGRSGEISIDYEHTNWWTRTSGTTPDLVVGVDFDGDMCEIDSNCDEIGVRPAMWVQIESPCCSTY